MKLRVDSEQLKAVMASKRMSNKELARRASSPECPISDRTISRMLSGKETGGFRRRNVEAVAAALHIKPGILTGELPAPNTGPLPASIETLDSPYDSETRWNMRLPKAVRNAYSLVALRYDVAAGRIVELAPLLFLLLAEQSLASRQQRLNEMQETYKARKELASESRHLPLEAAFDSTLDSIYASEQSSINERDLFAESLLDDEGLRTTQFDKDYSIEMENPFALFLNSLAINQPKVESLIEVDAVFRNQVGYTLCRDEALGLVDGDEALAGGILDGSLPLYELPVELKRYDKKIARLEWFRGKAAEREKALEEFPKPVTLTLDML